MDDVTQKILVTVLSGTGLACVEFARRRWLVPGFAFARRLPVLMNDIDFIKKEFKTNGGSSLKDRVTSISNSLSILEARQRGLIASLPRPTFEADADLNWTDVNRAMERLTGLGFSQLARKRWYSIVHDDDRASVVRDLHNALSDRRDVGISFRIVTDAGEVAVRLEAKPTFDSKSGDGILCWMGWIVNEEDRRIEERRQP